MRNLYAKIVNSKGSEVHKIDNEYLTIHIRHKQEGKSVLLASVQVIWDKDTNKAHTTVFNY